MVMRERFEIVYDPEVRTHLHSVPRQYHSLIRKTTQEQLWYEPQKVTKNRKPLAETDDLWEIRFGHQNRFRIFYSVNAVERRVEIHAVGIKDRDKLRIGGEEVEL